MSIFKKLKKNQVPLTPEERALVMARKAVWRFSPNRSASPAVWKSVDPKTGKVTYVTNTHRAYNARPTLAGAIGRYHKFIKSTASERYGAVLEKLAFDDFDYDIGEIAHDTAVRRAQKNGKFNQGVYDNTIDLINRKAQKLLKEHPLKAKADREMELSGKKMNKTTNWGVAGMLGGTVAGMMPMLLSKQKYPGLTMGLALPMAGIAGGAAVGGKLGAHKFQKQHGAEHSSLKGSRQKMVDDVLDKIKSTASERHGALIEKLAEFREECKAREAYYRARAKKKEQIPGTPEFIRARLKEKLKQED